MRLRLGRWQSCSSGTSCSALNAFFLSLMQEFKKQQTAIADKEKKIRKLVAETTRIGVSYGRSRLPCDSRPL